MPDKIKSIRLVNFQRHRKRKIVLSPEVTTIVGPTDAGKSAILRALKWVATNTLAGTGFIREGADEATVTLRLDKNKISRRRSKTDNTYIVNGVEFKALGKSGVPDQIKKLLRLDELNFQGQYDPPYWLSNTAGEVSRQLNRIVNLDVIDRTLKNLQTMQRENKTETRISEQRLEEARYARKQYQHAEAMNCDLARLEKRYAKWRKAALAVRELRGVCRGTRQLENAVQRLRNAAAASDNVVRLGERWQRAVRECADLEQLLEDIRQADTVARRPLPDISKLVSDAKELQRIEVECKELEKILVGALAAEQEAACIEQELEEREETLRKLVKKCPLCGSVIRKT